MEGKRQTAPLPLGKANYAFLAFGGTIASFTDFAIRNLTTFFAGILIDSPVAGLRPSPGFAFNAHKAADARHHEHALLLCLANSHLGELLEELLSDFVADACAFPPVL